MNRLVTLASAALITAVDQITKLTAESRLGGLPERQAAILVPDLLYLKPVKNTGALWGTFEGLSPWIFAAISGVFVVFTTLLILRLDESERGFLPWLGLALGGFLGNGIDRVRIGAVTDFIHFDGYTAWILASFNVADIAILVGILAIVLRFIFSRNARRACAGARLESEGS